MNGIELLQLIKEGKIEDDTFINVYYDDENLGRTLICELRYINNQIYWEEGTFKVSYLYNNSYEFQIVEKDIEELNMNITWEKSEINYKSYNESGESIARALQKFSNKIDELVEAVNKLKNRDK